MAGAAAGGGVLVAVEAALLVPGAFLWRAAGAVERASGAGRTGRANLVAALILLSGLVVPFLDVATA